MKQKGIEVLMLNSPENLYYLTGYLTTGYYTFQTLILPLEQEPMMVTRIIENQNVECRTWIKNSAYFADEEDPTTVTTKKLIESGLSKKTIGIEKDGRKAFLTISEYEKLQKWLPDSKIVDGTGIVESCRLIKSESELNYMRQAAKIVEKAMRAGIDTIRAGKLDGEVAGEVNKVLYSEGSEYPGDLPYVPSIPLTHANHANIRLKAGQIVRFEFAACVKRYHAALTRTVSLGELPEKYKRFEEASGKTLAKAIEVIRPGIEAQEAHKEIQDELARLGYGELHKHRSAYSIGIAFAPGWGEGDILSLKGGEHTVLQPGMVFHMVGAGLKIPGDIMLSTGSETIAVTKTGNEVLTNFPRKVFVK